MIHSIFQYLWPGLADHATKAITYYPFYTNSIPVCHSYYHYYDPVKGYTVSYYHRAYISCSPLKRAANYFFYKHPTGYKYHLYAGIKIRR